MAQLKETTATSAGGIVTRYEGSTAQLVIGRRVREHEGEARAGARSWTLPKGTPDLDETVEETALREVREETGLKVRIAGPLGSIEYTFVQRGARVHKTVHYFMMEPTGGGFEDHDHEFEEVRWVSFDEAAAMLTFDTERAIVAQAAARLAVTAT